MKIIDKIKEFFKSEEESDGWNFKEQPEKLELRGTQRKPTCFNRGMNLVNNFV